MIELCACVNVCTLIYLDDLDFCNEDRHHHELIWVCLDEKSFYENFGVCPYMYIIQHTLH